MEIARECCGMADATIMLHSIVSAIMEARDITYSNEGK